MLSITYPAGNNSQYEMSSYYTDTYKIEKITSDWKRFSLNGVCSRRQVSIHFIVLVSGWPIMFTAQFHAVTVTVIGHNRFDDWTANGHHFIERTSNVCTLQWYMYVYIYIHNSIDIKIHGSLETSTRRKRTVKEI